jgi:hypothetical protein
VRWSFNGDDRKGRKGTQRKSEGQKGQEEEDEGTRFFSVLSVLSVVQDFAVPLRTFASFAVNASFAVKSLSVDHPCEPAGVLHPQQ